MTTAEHFYKWACKRLGPLKAKSYCRSKWNQYGEKMIKRAIYCSSVSSIETMDAKLIALTEKKKLPPVWTPPS